MKSLPEYIRGVLLAAFFVAIASLLPAQTIPPTLIPVNGAVTLSATADGTAPFSYQWVKDGNNIPATGASLVIPNFTRSEAGTYTVTVSNSAGSATASPVVLAILTVKPSNVKIGIAVSPPSTAATSTTAAK